MKKLLVLTVALLLTAGIAYAKDYEVQKKAGEYNVIVRMDKNPPVAGDNNVTIEITDASGKPVTDAKVALECSMPPMPGMPPHSGHTAAELKGNKYTATMELVMRGSWNIAVKITRGGKTSSLKFSVDAQ